MAYFATSRHGSFAEKWINVAGLSKTHFYEKYLMQMKGQNMCTDILLKMAIYDFPKYWVFHF